MKPADRYAWIQAFMARSYLHETVDVLYSDFVWEYIEATDAKCAVQPFGAPKCPQLGRDLSAMYRAGMVRRRTMGIDDGLCHQGFPRWVYQYLPLKQSTITQPDN